MIRRTSDDPARPSHGPVPVGALWQEAGDEGLAEAVFVGAVDPLLVLSHDGTVLHANPAATAVLGDVVGSPFGVPTTPGDVTEVDLRTSAGHRTAELRVGRARLHDEPVYVASLRDVTVRKRAETTLRDFVANASHEFRSPLFAISGYAEILVTDWDELTPLERRDHAATIHRQAARLAQLSDDLLLLSALDADGASVVPTATSVRAAFDQVTDDVPLPVSLSGGEVEVRADAGHLAEILSNLLSNAAKYGDPPLQVVARRSGDVVEICVVDHGDGVPCAFRGRMFDRFSRHRSTARRASGTGLGLAIVRALLLRNGGSVRYEDTTGGGATFVVTLPAA